jgi:hypothetical protein
MTMRATSWPKLIGVIVVMLGIAFSLKASDFVFSIVEGDSFGSVRGYVWLVAALGSIASIVVGAAAYSGREWARRTLVVVTAVGIVFCVGYAYLGVTRSISALGQLQPQFILWTRLVFVGEALRAVSPPVFFLLILLQPDVAGSFQPAATRTI